MVDEKPTESKEGSGCRCPLPYVVSHIHEVSLFLDGQPDGNITSICHLARFTFISMLSITRVWIRPIFVEMSDR